MTIRAQHGGSLLQPWSIPVGVVSRCKFGEAVLRFSVDTLLGSGGKEQAAVAQAYTPESSTRKPTYMCNKKAARQAHEVTTTRKQAEKERLI